MAWYDKLNPSNWGKDAKKKFDGVFNDIKKLGERAIKELNSVRQKATDLIAEKGKKYAKVVDDKFKEAGGKIKGEVEGVAKKAKSELSGVGNKIKKELTNAGKDIEKDLKGVGEEIKKGLQKTIKSGAPEVLIDTLVPNEISVSFELVGNGVSASWSDNEDIVKEIYMKVKGGDFDKDILWEFIPDSISVSVGAELALVVSVDVGAELSYNAKDDIKTIVDWFKKNT